MADKPKFDLVGVVATDDLPPATPYTGGYWGVWNRTLDKLLLGHIPEGIAVFCFETRELAQEFIEYNQLGPDVEPKWLPPEQVN